MLADLIKVHAIVLVFLLHCAVVGMAALKPLALWGDTPADARRNGPLQCFFFISAGLFINIAALFALGMARAFNVGGVLATGVALFVLAWPWASRQMAVQRLKWPSGAALVDALVLAVFLFIAVVSAFHAPGHWDDTMYQLPLARDTLRHEGIVLNDYLRFPLFPQNINLLIALGLMAGGDVMAQAFATLPLFVIALGLIGASRWLIGATIPGVLASLLLFTMGPVKRNIGYAYVDDGLALFCWGATLALALWAASDSKRRSWGWLIVAGVLAGAAAGSKYFGGVMAVLGGAYLLLLRRDARAFALYSVVVLLAGSWWAVRSFVLSGDPVHPAGGNVFGHFLWNAADLARQSEEQAGFGTPRNPLYIVAALKEAGVAVWVLGIASLAFRKSPPAMRVLQLLFLAYLAFWFFVTQVPRYLAPVYGVGCLLSCYTLYRVYLWLPASFTQAARKRRVLAGWVVAAMLVAYAADRYAKYQAETAGQQAILAREPGYQLFTAASALIPQLGDRLVQIGFENAIYFFDGTVIGDWFGPGRYSGMLDCRQKECTPLDAEALARYLEKAGSRMLIVSTVSYPEFDVDAYRPFFDVKLRSHDGVLLLLKSEAARNQ